MVDLLRRRRVLRIVERLHRIHRRQAPSAEEGDGRRPGLDRYRRIAETYVIERNFTWRQSSLTAIQIQLFGVSLGSVAFILGLNIPGLLVMGACTGWVLVHECVEARDRRRNERVLTEEPAALGVLAIGGYGALPAKDAHLWSQQDGAAGIRWLASVWELEHPFTPGQRETFDALAPEYLGTVDELYVVSLGLDPSGEHGQRSEDKST